MSATEEKGQREASLDTIEGESGSEDTLDREIGSLLDAGEGPALTALEGRALAGKYRLESLLGAGGMGQVYRATHLETGGLHALEGVRFPPHGARPFRKRSERLGTLEQERLSARWTRTTTAAWRQSAEKQKLWELIEGLPPDDRELLILRLGRKMAWKEIALVLLGGEADASTLKARAAAARKRFERLKERLKQELTPKDNH